MATVERRVGVIFGLFFLLLVIAAGRTVYLGVLRAGTLRKAASNQQLTYEAVVAPRGTITDRDGVDLAVSEPAQDISADPYLIEKPLEDAHLLAPLLGQPQASVLTALSQRAGFVYLARALPEKRAQKVLALRLTGVTGTPVMHRVYPRGTLAAQVLGVVGTEGNGLAGLEYSSNSVLTGHSGQRRVVSDARGQPLSISETKREVPGKSLTLTLDTNIQQRAEDVLGAVARVFAPKDATAIVMDPRTGAILALANWPQVDVNDPGLSPSEAMEDRAVGLDYEPGSTFKVVAVSGALEAGLITPDTPFDIPDEIQVAERTIHDDTEHPEETLTTSQILARSSNVGAIKIGELEGPNRFNEWVHRYGFGSPTGVELPGEESGVTLPLTEYSGSSMGNLPIGQGELVTPMQMATAYAAIANGGILRPPHIISAIGGKPQPQPAGHRVISDEDRGRAAPDAGRGAGARKARPHEVSIPDYKLAGKTGTASKIDPETGEYSKEQICRVVHRLRAGRATRSCCVRWSSTNRAPGSIYGGTVAAPAFGQIMSFALPYLNIPPG